MFCAISGNFIIVFYDIWKANEIKEAAELFKFKQPRIGAWIKKNPVINKQLFRFKISRDIARLLAKELKSNKHLNFSTYGRR